MAEWEPFKPYSKLRLFISSSFISLNEWSIAIDKYSGFASICIQRLFFLLFGTKGEILMLPDFKVVSLSLIKGNSFLKHQ
ncbi:hypothetical protein [Lysinibacillus xylanilyticus]|uniref:hypothetical protein n=1 Tax=Lysinibacillus xylanilyticus TaxID=582475 RepID=UPI003CFC927B